jgi:serine/threonine protein kinase
VPLDRDSRLGNYIIRQRLASGGMGVVYRVRHAQMGREFALKTIHPDKATDKDFVSRFRREALAIAKIDHPNIVAVTDFFEGDPAKGETSYIVMEYLKGKDLAKIIRETGPLGITRAVDRTLEILAAVGECHRLGFLHRDIKPGNIFLTERDQIETAKMLDFGVAKALAEMSSGAAADPELTRKGFVFGTPEYLAPELLRGQPATPKADQYAIGVVLYTALTGRKPFISTGKAEMPYLDLCNLVVKGDYPKARKLRPDIPEGLEAAIESAMRVNPADRFFDLRTFGAALLPWASDAAKHRWTAHFTSAAPDRVQAPPSVAIDQTSDHSTGRDAPAKTISTVASDPKRRNTVPIESAELRALAGEINVATTARQDARSTVRQELDPTNIDFPPAAESPSQSLSVSIDEPGHPTGSASTISPARPASSSEILRRPSTLIAGAAAMLGAGILVALLLHRSRPAPMLHQEPPPNLLDRTTATPAAPGLKSLPPPEPPGSPLPAPSAPAYPLPVPSVPTHPLPAPTTATAPAGPGGDEARAGARKRAPHKRKHQPVVDQKGFPIPSD